jgi:hypothetical protein
MQMIDVLKRLAELDEQNPNIVKESQQVEECGMMPEMGLGMPVSQPHTPASISMTADSGDELSGMLRDIMMLAGQAQTPHVPSTPSGAEAPQILEPATGGEGPEAGNEPPKGPGAGAGAGDPVDDMRAVIDKLHDASGDLPDGEETDESEYDNTPSDPNDKNEFDANQFAHKENQPGQGDRMDGTSPKAYADTNEAVADLFAEYKKFISEN